LVYLIFFITYTPIDIDHFRGVQGRYFVISLPLAAIFLAAIANFDLPRGVAIAAIFGSFLSGIALSRHFSRRIGRCHSFERPPAYRYTTEGGLGPPK
jgi:hypothetical protein